MNVLSSVLPVLALAGAISAQVFVVDASNGPGTDFTEIAAAVAAVPDGAVLDVRAGSYLPFEIDDKSVTVLGGPGVVVTAPLFVQNDSEVRNLAPQRTVSIRGIDWIGSWYTPTLGLRDCRGTVVIDGCTFGLQGMPDWGKLTVSRCDRVLVRETTLIGEGLFGPGIECFESNLCLLDSRVTSAGLCLRQNGGRVEITGGSVERDPSVHAAALLFVNDGVLALNGDVLLLGLAASPTPGVSGSGTLVLDPSTNLQFIATPAFDPNLTLENRVIPALRADAGSLGGTATASLAVPSGSMAALHVGFAATPTQAAGVLGALWLAAPAALHAVGGAPTLAGSYAVPNFTWALGVEITWQGVVFDSGTGVVAVSNPAGYVHHG